MDTPAAAVRAWLARAEARGWMGTPGDPPDPAVIEQAVEELEVAEQEMRAQNDELLATAAELEAERSRYLELFEAAPDSYFVTDAVGLIRRANRAAHELLGIQPPRLEGKPLAVLVPDHGRSEFRAYLSQLARLERISNWQSTLQARDGSPIPVAISAVPAPSGGDTPLEIRWLFRDLRPQHAADEARRTLRHEHAARLASERAAEQAGFLALAGRSFLEITGAGDMERRIVAEAVPRLADMAILFIHEGDRLRCAAVKHRDSAAADDLDAIIGHEIGDGEYDGPARAARTGDLDLIPHPEPGFVAYYLGLEDHPSMRDTGMALAVPLHERGRVRAVLWLVNRRDRPFDPDVTPLAETYADRAMAALQSAVAHDELLRARDEAARANEEKAHAFAALSHDFRTPLAAVIGYTDLLLEGLIPDVPDRALDWIRRIRASSEHQLSLVDQVLSYTRLESGHEQVHYQTVDLRALVQTSADLIRSKADQAGLELRVVCPDREILVNTDPGKVRQILINLLSNALRFTPDGHIGVSLECVEQDAILCVYDSGVGIPPEAQSRIFDRFWQAEPRSLSTSNVGLGLTIARELTRLLGGSIEVESQPQRGSTFRVRLFGIRV